MHPLANVLSAMKSVENDPFQWMHSIRAEGIWYDIAKDLHISSKFSFNNASMTLLRGDGHVDLQHTPTGKSFGDCLHNCMPGIPDFWNWLFYNTILQLVPHDSSIVKDI